MRTLRRLVAILLLAVLGLPFALSSAALGQDADAGMPACCRRAGQHHCGMSMGERAQHASHDPQFQRPMECCPYCPASTVVRHPDPFNTPADLRVLQTAFKSQPAVVAQTESRWRIARDRSRQKRGPPPSLNA